MTKEIITEKLVENLDGKMVTATRIKNDMNGNPRWVVHFLSLGVELKDYGKIKGLKRYNAKWYGGGYLFESCFNIEEDLKYYHQKVKDYYSKEEL